MASARAPRVSRHRPALTEPLENRVLLASAAGVEDILLPEYIAQLADPNGNQLPATDAWWALRSQRNMAIDEPISNVQNFAAHNAFNSLNEGFKITTFFTVLPIPQAPNQILSFTGLLDTGARLMELDVHDPAELFNSRDLILKHGPDLVQATRAVPFPLYLDDALAEIRAWMDRPDNSNEIVFLDFEDATEQNEAGADDPLLPHLDRFGSLIYTPAERAADGAWPSRAELLSRGKRVIIFSHRNDEFHGRFGVPTEYTDPNGHVWFGSSLAFRANGSDDPVSDRGNFTQTNIDDFDFVSTNRSEDPNFFFSVQSDGLRNFTARRYDTDDVRAAARLNVDFMKMDFLFSDDEDADLGSIGDNDLAFDIPQDNRIAIAEAAVWSWAKNDPAVDRQMFMDLVPGDGTGAAMRDYLAAKIAALGNRLPADTMDQLDAIGAAARSNGRDVAIQVNGRWLSEAPEGFVFPRHFAARSVLPGANGHYEWRVTTAESISWFNGPQIVQSEFGSDFIFAGPVNGFQNDQLKTAAGGNLVWMNVHDFDRDGNWTVGNRAPRITSITAAPTSVNEGQLVQLTVDFTDEPEGHTALIDWGDGSPASSATVLQGLPQQVVISHLYKDDHPATATASDLLTIGVTITDAGGFSTTGSTQVTVANLAPDITSFTSSATLATAADEGAPIGILASFTDPGVADTHSAIVNWGDGSAPEVVTVTQGSGSGTVNGTHAYAAGGLYMITLSLTDDDTGADTATTTAFIKGVGVTNGVLFVIGSAGDEHGKIDQTPKGKLKVDLDSLKGKSREFDASAVTKIIAYLGEGDDHLMIDNKGSLLGLISLSKRRP
jgi:hypothetical protein